jgi:hypothetical protein
MALMKKPKKGPPKIGGFDATPPGDGNMGPGNGKKPNPGTPNPLNEGKKGIQKFLNQYKTFLIVSFRGSPRIQQESWISRFAQICCVGISCVILNSFYSVLLPVIRIIALPIICGAAWFVANKVVAPAIIKRLGNNMNDF